MKLTQLTTHWDAADAECVITFLDELREVLITAYGDEIAQMLKQARANRQSHPSVDDNNNA